MTLTMTMTEQNGQPAESMLTQAWELSPSVALRPEPFGALAYHFGNRKLTFLKRPELVELVRVLGSHVDVGAALAAVDIPPTSHEGYLAALRGLATTDMIRRREPLAPPYGAPSPLDEEEQA